MYTKYIAMPWLVVALVAGGSCAPAAWAQAPDPCGSPQDAARSLLDELQPGRWSPEAAAACLDVPESRADEAPALAVRLKEVLDARGLYVTTEDLPTELGYVDDHGVAVVRPVPTEPWLKLVRQGDRWVWSRRVVDRVDALHAETFTGLAARVRELVPPAWQDARLLGVAPWQALHAAILVGLALLAGRVVQALLRSQLLSMAQSLGVIFQPGFLRRTQGPIWWLAIGLVLRWGIPDLQLPVRASQALLLLANATLSVATAVILLRLVDVAADVLGQRARKTDSKLDDQVVPLLSRSAKVAIVVLGVVFVMQNAGVEVASLVAGLGLGGLAFALAAKDTVENLFGWMTIFADRPFSIGDWVVLDSGVEGTVEEVGFRSTRIRTFANSLVSVPNGKVATAVIDNLGLRQRRRVKITLGLTYDTPRDRLHAFVDAVRAAVKAHPRVSPEVQEIHFTNFGGSSLDILVYFFLEVPNWHEELAARGELFAEFLRIAEEVGVSFAFPSQSVYVESMPQPRP